MPDIFPSEAHPTDASVALLDGTTDPATGLPYIARGVGPASTPSYEVQYNRRLRRQNRRLALITEGLVVDEGGLKIGVYPFDYRLGGAFKRFAGATQQAVPDGATRYAYVDSANALQIAATEPTDLTSFVPLAQIVASGGALTITPRTNLVRMSVPALSAAPAGAGLMLAAGALAVAVDGATIEVASNQLRIKDGAVSAAKLAASMAQRLPQAAFTIGAEDAPAADDRLITIQLQDAHDQPLAARHFLRIWVATSDFGVPTGAGHTLAVTLGGLHGTDTTNGAVRVITDATGQAQVKINTAGAVTRYIMAAVGSRIFSSGGVTWNIS